MEFACHTWSFNDLTLPEALGTIARLGFRRADIGSGPGLNAARAADNPRRAAQDLRADLDLYHLELSDLYLMLPRISLADAERRDKDIELFRGLMPFAAELGTPGITVSPGLAHPDEEKEAAWTRTVEALRAMVEAAQAVDLPVSVEPHLDSMAPTPAEALRLLDAVPGLGITLDWAHQVCQGVAHGEIMKLVPHTRHIHLRQAARNQLQSPFERGKIDLSRAVRDLLAADYGGTLCVEMMNITGRHGVVAVNAVRESARLRDALRDARDAELSKQQG